MNWRIRLKQEIKYYITDAVENTYFVRYKGEIAGVFIVEPETLVSIPKCEKIFILERFRKGKTIVVIADFILNYLFPGKGLQVEEDDIPGLEKLFIKVLRSIDIFVLHPDVNKRINKIIKRCEDGII
jgi:hypothetical protein